MQNREPGSSTCCASSFEDPEHLSTTSVVAPCTCVSSFDYFLVVALCMGVSSSRLLWWLRRVSSLTLSGEACGCVVGNGHGVLARGGSASPQVELVSLVSRSG